MSGVAAIAFAAAFTSCSKSTDLYDQGAVDERNRQEQEKKDQQKVENVQASYEAAFKNAFGQPAAGQDWGFGDSNAATRAFTRAKGDYSSYKGNWSSSFDFPEDCDASKFLAAVPDGVQKMPADGEVKGGTYYIDNTTTKVNMNTGAGVIYVDGTVDLSSDDCFEITQNTEIYLIKGSTLKLGTKDANKLKAIIYIESTATLETANRLKMDNTSKVYNHGTINAGAFEVNVTSFLYNVGTLNAPNGLVYVANNNSSIVNDGTIIAGDVEVAGSGHVQNNAEWTVNGTTTVNSNSASWVNNGHWTTNYYNYTAGSENVINNCFLEVKEDFDINLGDGGGTKGFKIDAGGGVLTKNFNGGKNGSSLSGPYRIIMGANAVFKVTGTAALAAGSEGTWNGGPKYGYGFFGPDEGGYAVFQATHIVKAGNETDMKVMYGGNLYVSAEDHFATEYNPYNKNVTFSLGCTKANIFTTAEGDEFSTGKPNITIEETPCNPGFEGTETEPTEVRVICEDLFATSGSDFDFNDLVFDVVFGTNAKIIIRAAGGTLPIYINNGTEIHKLMGNDTPDEKGLLPMLNTGAAAKGLYGDDNVAAKEIELGFAINKRKEIPEKITIKVVKDGTEYTLQNNENAASMICVGTDFTPWMGERDQLKLAYPKFVDFVQTGKPAWNKWYK